MITFETVKSVNLVVTSHGDSWVKVMFEDVEGTLMVPEDTGLAEPHWRARIGTTIPVSRRQILGTNYQAYWRIHERFGIPRKGVENRWLRRQELLNINSQYGKFATGGMVHTQMYGRGLRPRMHVPEPFEPLDWSLDRKQPGNLWSRIKRRMFGDSR